jgi:hypothetical protein
LNKDSALQTATSIIKQKPRSKTPSLNDAMIWGLLELHVVNDKWDHTQKDFKKVWNYEQNTPSRRSSFWAMTRSEGKPALKLRKIMPKQVYD